MNFSRDKLIYRSLYRRVVSSPKVHPPIPIDRQSKSGTIR